MSEDRAREVAERFHAAYERLAPSFGYETRAETRAFDPATPNGRLMIAVCAEILPALASEREAIGRAAGREDVLALARHWSTPGAKVLSSMSGLSDGEHRIAQRTAAGIVEAAAALPVDGGKDGAA